MGRDSYDDMVSPSRGGRGRKGGSRAGIIAALGILVCLIAVIIYIFLSPGKSEEAPAQGQTPVSVEVRKIEEVVPAETQSTSPAVSEEPVVVRVDTPAETAPVQVETVQSTASVAPTRTTTSTSSTTAARDISSALSQSSSSGVVKFVNHTVAEGEDLSSIASMYGLTTETLISINRIRNVAAVVPGTVLSIPDRDGRYYTVQEGDMLSTIARKYNPDLGWKQLQEINGLKTENIRVGQELFIPDPEVAAPGVVSVSALSFAKPLNGSVSATFGQRIDGQALSGIYMTAPAGSAVTAAAKGAVIDVGNDTDLGRFVVIQHDEGYKTSYYYLETVTVRIGAEVAEGDVIGSIGTSNQKFTRPTLYFKIEQNGIALDPGFFF